MWNRVGENSGLGRGSALAAVLCLTLGACSGGSVGPGPAGPQPAATQPPAPQAGGVFYAFIRQPASIDPGRAQDAEELAVDSELFDSLTATDEQLRVVPAAAVSWDSDPQATTFTFHLRPGAVFHNGEPVNAEAFKRGWRRIANRTGATASPARYLLSIVQGFEQAQNGGELSGMTAVDERTLRVTLTSPFAEFPAVVSHPALAPVPQAALNDPDGFGRLPVGNGPFRMDGPWQPGQFIRLEGFDRYPGTKPLLEKVVYRIYDGAQAPNEGYDDFSKGRLDLAPIPQGRLKDAVTRYGTSKDGYTGPGVVDGTRLITAFYAFNTERPPFDDPTVRQALSLLIDRDAIVADLEGRVPARSVVPPAIPSYQSPPCGFCSYDPARARQLLAGRRLGPIELVYYDGPDHEAVARRVQRDVDAALGPGTLNLKALPQADWLNAVQRGEANFFLSGWLAEYPTPDSFLHLLFHSSRIGADNLSRYRSPRVSELLDMSRRELDPARRLDLQRQAEALILTDMPVAPLFHYRNERVVGARVRGLTITAMGTVDLSKVWLEGGG